MRLIAEDREVRAPVDKKSGIVGGDPEVGLAAPSPGTAYLRFLEELTPETLPRLADYLAPSVRFHDPFNDVTGPEAMRRVFERMFEDLRSVDFAVGEIVEAPGVAFARWRFKAAFARRDGKHLDFVGMSEVRFDADGRVLDHFDMWDPTAAVFDDVPALGWVLRRIKRRLAIN